MICGLKSVINHTIVRFIILMIIFGSHAYAANQVIDKLNQIVKVATIDDKDAELAKPVDGNKINEAYKPIPVAPYQSQGEFTSPSNAAKDFFKNAFAPEELPHYFSKISWHNLLVKILRILFIISFAIFLWKVSNAAIQKYVKKLKLFQKVSNRTGTETAALMKTVAPIIRSIFHWALTILTSLIVLSEIGVNITPIILSFSVVGLAFSIGSQTLVKDLINGILTLFEGNVSVGDVVTVGNSVGTVESMSLRSLLLRHFTGELQTIPFSEISMLINCSRDFSVAVIEFVVEPVASMATIQIALNETYESMKEDVMFSSYIQGDLTPIGIKTMKETGVVISVKIPLHPDPRRNFVPEFNRRLFENLQKQHVPLAFLHAV